MALFPRMSVFRPPVRTYHQEFSPFLSLFNDTFSELQRLSDSLPVATTSFSPKFDVKETKDAYELQGELPGIEHKNLVIEFSDDHTLLINGRTEHTREEAPVFGEQQKDDQSDATTEQSTEVATTGSKEVAKQAGQQQTYWVSERSVGEFSRSFSFPQRVNQDAIKASLKNGILSVVVPKIGQQTTRRKIEVESE
ncbi:30 kDa heat shock protein [Cyphellophora attinorum]|uniref:30 kDa heat shock protein n=1 Tax=Cyphellophora attinorum TaxID=1664694 RepID=A0A0N1H2M0_9EURO|nr:30 kDa heat shock protein [Phialophora attinorum]KPI34647.1 30 kDa heat shock protein [Phialophora attinorum]